MELEDLDGVVNLQPAFAKATEGSPRLHPRSSLLRQSNRFGCEGQKLRGIRRRGIRRVTYEMLFVKHEGNFAVCVGLSRNERQDTPSVSVIHERFCPQSRIWKSESHAVSDRGRRLARRVRRRDGAAA